jgi:hypothetical protein
VEEGMWLGLEGGLFALEGEEKQPGLREQESRYELEEK